MDILRLIEKNFVRLLIIVNLLTIQSCSNTLLGEKLENSFDSKENPSSSKNINNKSKKTKKLKSQPEIKAEKNDNEKELDGFMKKNSISNKNRLSQKPIKIVNEEIFTPQPYRIIIRLSGANPSAPAETVTEALRKAGVQFEVEKIERFDDRNSSKDRSSKR